MLGVSHQTVPFSCWWLCFFLLFFISFCSIFWFLFLLPLFFLFLLLPFFLFIPFFNFYWVFQAYRGWAVDCNRTLAACGVTAPRALEGVALTMCILSIFGLIPYVGMLFSFVNMILGLLFFSSAIDCVNALVNATAGRAEPSSTA